MAAGRAQPCSAAGAAAGTEPARPPPRRRLSPYPPGNARTGGRERSAVARGAGRRLPGPGSLRDAGGASWEGSAGGRGGARGGVGVSSVPFVCATLYLIERLRNVGSGPEGRGSAQRAIPSLGASRTGGSEMRALGRVTRGCLSLRAAPRHLREALSARPRQRW